MALAKTNTLVTDVGKCGSARLGKAEERLPKECRLRNCWLWIDP